MPGETAEWDEFRTGEMNEDGGEMDREDAPGNRLLRLCMERPTADGLHVQLLL